MIKYTSILFFIFLSLNALKAQYFSDPVTFFSKSGASYLELKTGERLTCKLVRLEKTKGLVTGISFEIDATEVSYTAKEIAQVYLLEQGYQKHVGIIDYKEEQYANGDPIEQLLENGYVLFQQSNLEIKGKEVDCLLQILNPYSAEQVSVYHDPFAMLSTNDGGTSYSISGGTYSSFYLTVGKDSFRLKRKKYADNWERIFSKCPDFINVLEENWKWKDFGKMINEYNGFCRE